MQRTQVVFDVPKSGWTVPPNARFRLLVTGPTALEQAAHKDDFRLIDSHGKPLAVRVETVWDRYREVVPLRPLATGTVTFWMRSPEDGAKNADEWRQVTEVTIRGVPDKSPPVFLGIRAGSVSAVAGDVVVGPHRVARGWRLRTVIYFDEPRETNWPDDAQLYEIARAKPGTSKFERVTSFRPSREGSDSFVAWEQEQGWGETWIYRIRVRDPAGNETVGPRVLQLSSPDVPESPPDP